MVVNRFFKIPCDRLQGNDISGIQIIAQCWCEGKLLINLKYGVTIHEFDNKGTWKGTGSGVPESAIAIFDPSAEKWDIVTDPVDDFQTLDWTNRSREIEYSFHDDILFRDDLFLSEDDWIKKFDFRNREWHTLPLSKQEVNRLFAVEGHLFAVSGNAISEITDDEKGTRILASTRRRPAVAVLDSLNDLGSPVLFAGPNKFLRACIGNKIYSWDGKDWPEIFDFGFIPQTEVFEEGVLFKQGIHFFPYEPPGVQDKHYNIETLWILQKDQSKPELCLYEKAKKEPGRNQQGPVEQVPEAVWQLPKDESLINSGVTFYRSNLYFFVDHAIVTNVADQYHWTVLEKDGYHAQLICLSRDCPDPVVVPLKFDLDRGPAPLKCLADKTSNLLSDDPQLTWLFFSGDQLYIGQKRTLGVWTIPISEVDLAVAAQKQIQLAKKAQEKAQAAAAAEQYRQDLEKRHQDMGKYDRNHNGVIDPEEKEEALDDPAFIESELDAIDTNHNGWLDAEELVYFDANQNKILEPKEQAGIEIAQHLLAKRLLKKFDANGDGFLDRSEFNNLVQSSMGTSARSMPGLLVPFPDENHDGQVDLGELESFLKQQTRRELHLRGGPTTVPFNRSQGDANQPVDRQQLFKAAVELYWQNPGGITNGPPFNRGIPPGRRGITNGPQSNITP